MTRIKSQDAHNRPYLISAKMDGLGLRFLSESVESPENESKIPVILLH